MPDIASLTRNVIEKTQEAIAHVDKVLVEHKTYTDKLEAALADRDRTLAELAEQEPVAWTNADALADVYSDSTAIMGPKDVVGDIPLFALPPGTDARSLDERMKSAGMLTASQILSGRPLDAFIRHPGVVDLPSLVQWAEMRRAEFVRMQAQYDLGDKPKDDMYEWVISHVAAFTELHVNLRAVVDQDTSKI